MSKSKTNLKATVRVAGFTFLPYTLIQQDFSEQFTVLITLALTALCAYLAYQLYQNKRYLQHSELQQKEQSALAKSYRQRYLQKESELQLLSHDIRTPLHTIVSLTHYMLNQPVAQLAENELKTLLFASNHLLDLSTNFLATSRGEAVHFRPERVAFDLKGLVRDHCQGIRLQAQQKGLAVHDQCAPELAESYLGSPIHIGLILNNLLSNAVKYTDQGWIEVRVMPVEDGTILFRIADTGKGIPIHLQQQIFERFMRIPQEGPEATPGWGLGLAISQQLLLAMGSALKVKSEVQVGTTFEFRLPLQTTGPSDQLYLQGKRALIVEDHRINQQILCRLLKQWGLETATASNGRIAFEKLQQKDYDLIFMDLMMPELDGLQTIRMIREELPPPKSSVPVIGMTATTSAETLRQMKQAGFTTLLSKPFHQQSLLNCMQQAFQLEPGSALNFRSHGLSAGA
ncbi:MAG: response regulator [Phaeodactylibacter sp.]|nr:response regulator [Phaeodactylibacter sp.]